MERQLKIRLRAIRMRLSRSWNRAFKERELLLRVDGRVRYLRLTRRRQMVWAAAACGLSLWLVVSSLGFWLQPGPTKIVAAPGVEERHSARLQESLESAREENVALAAERDRLIRDAVAADAQLAEIAAERAGLRNRVAALEQRFELADQDRTRLAAERAELERSLDKTEERLADLAAENAESARRASGLAQDLELAEKDKAAFAEAGEGLERTVTDLEAQLAELSAVKARTLAEAEELDRRLALAERDREALAAEKVWLEQDLVWAEAQLTAISADRADLARTVSDFQTGYNLALAAEPMLAGRVETLEGELKDTLDRAERAESQREFFEARAERLEDRLEGFAEVQNGLVQRLSDTTLQGVGMIEKVVAMTGLNVNELILSLEKERIGSDQGGPFLPGNLTPEDFLPEEYDEAAQKTDGFLIADHIADGMVDGDYLLDGEPDLEYQVSVFLLDQQMDRWEALQHVIRSVPLSSPLDQYRVSSGFGKRKDPVNGKRAMHLGLDLSAPMRTPVLATAPGRVVFVGWMGGHGRIIELDHGNGFRTRYAHLRKFLVEEGQEVEHRQEIGLVGNSGRTTGPHVHYEVLFNGKPYDPMKFVVAGRNAFKG